MSAQRIEITDNLELLLEVLPPHIRAGVAAQGDPERLVEVILDLGRQPEARYMDRSVYLNGGYISREDLQYVVSRIGAFTKDNRAGIERTLHRISAMRNRLGDVIGLTCRVGRAVFGTVDIVRDVIESGQSVLLLGPPGVGKCVTGDSLILTTNGLQPLAHLIPTDLDEDQFAPIQATVLGANGFEPASHAYNGGLTKTLRVTSRQGFSLEGTPQHPVLALRQTGELVFKRLDQLKLGDYVAIQRGQHVFGAETRLPSFAFTRRTNARDGVVPLELTEDLGRFLGYLIAEGTLSFDNQVYFSNTDPEIQSDMADLTEALFGLCLRRHLYQGRWNGKDFRSFSVKLRRFLEHLGLTRGRAASKRIPACILTAPKPVVTAFLQALFEGDGSIYGPYGRIEISSASRVLMSQLHVLLLNYGIVGCLRAKYNAQYDRHYYSITLISENVARFAAEIGFLSTTKRVKLAKFIAMIDETARNPNVDIIPYQNDRLRELRARVGKSSETFYRFTQPDNRAPSYHTLQRILTEAQGAMADPVYQALHSLAEAHFFFDSVKQIEESEAHVFDLSVPGSHSFFTNGFISHNTTLLREAARVTADELGKRVVVVDTSNEIAGDGDIPHPGIGRARRMQVPSPEQQHAVMIEAVENHMPEVIVIDEIGTEAEALAARTIAERGVQLIATAHGQSLDNLLLNPTLSDLVGGIQPVTLSDEEARRRGTQKTVLERKAPPTFDVLIEIQSQDRFAIHHDVATVVDRFLRGAALSPEVRIRKENYEVEVVTPAAPTATAPPGLSSQPVPPPPQKKVLRIYPYGVTRQRLERAIHDLQVPAYATTKLEQADLILTLKGHAKGQSKKLREATNRQVPVYAIKSNTLKQIQGFLREIFDEADYLNQRDAALREVEDAITRVVSEQQPVELPPTNSYIRRLQHQLVGQYGLLSESKGREPFRRVVIYPVERG